MNYKLLFILILVGCSNGALYNTMFHISCGIEECREALEIVNNFAKHEKLQKENRTRDYTNISGQPNALLVRYSREEPFYFFMTVDNIMLSKGFDLHMAVPMDTVKDCDICDRFNGSVVHELSERFLVEHSKDGEIRNAHVIKIE